MNDYQKNMEQNKGAPPSWCVLPWSHIYTDTNGKYKLCCKTVENLRDNHGRSFHVARSSWEEILNSDGMKSIRRDMLEGKWPDTCKQCKKEHESGMSPFNMSVRLMLAQNMEHEVYPGYKKTKTLTRRDGSISLKDFPVSYFDIRFGNLCNLKCVTCNLPQSSKWYADHKALWENIISKDSSRENKTGHPGKRGSEKDIYNWGENAQLWAQIEKHIINFRLVNIAGGEPLLIKAHYNFLQKCVDKDMAKNILLNYYSNITHIPEKAWSFWKHFKVIVMSISLDGFGVVNDFIRYPSKWNHQEKQLAKFDTDTVEVEGNIVPIICPTVSVLNIWHLPEFIEYLMKKNYTRINPSPGTPLMYDHPVHFPKHLNINILEDSFKEQIKNHFNECKKRISDFNWQSAYGQSNQFSWEEKIQTAHSILDQNIHYMYSYRYDPKELVNLRKGFIHFMDKLDTLRKTNWPETLPELYKSTLKWRT